MAYVAKLTSKGQMTLPLGVRQELGVSSGDYVRIERTPDGAFLLKPAARVADLVGMVRHTGPARSVAEIRAASRATFTK